MNQLSVFNYNSEQVRTVSKHGEVWFVAKDVCEILGISNHKDATTRLSNTMKDEVGITDAIGRVQKTTVVSEAGVYKLVFTSRKPEAEKFTDWIASEVIPSVRKNGGYIANQENLTPEQIVSNALLVAQRIIEEKDRQLETQKPKVLFADAVSASKSSILIGELAKILKQNDINMGQNRLFEWLRKNAGTQVDKEHEDTACIYAT